MRKHGPRPSGNPMWEQTHKVRIDKDGTVRPPVKTNGKDGIVIGDPALAVPPREERADRHLHPLLRLKRRLARI